MLDQWIDEHSRKKLPSRALVLALSHGRLDESTHEDEEFKTKEIVFESPVSASALEVLLQSEGDGLFRAKGIIPIQGEGNCVVQFAAGRLELTPTDEAQTPLTLIGIALQSGEVSA